MPLPVLAAPLSIPRSVGLVLNAIDGLITAILNTDGVAGNADLARLNANIKQPMPDCAVPRAKHFPDLRSRHVLDHIKVVKQIEVCGYLDSLDRDMFNCVSLAAVTAPIRFRLWPNPEDKLLAT
jgi:hypothetical protein